MNKFMKKKKKKGHGPFWVNTDTVIDGLVSHIICNMDMEDPLFYMYFHIHLKL